MAKPRAPLGPRPSSSIRAIPRPLRASCQNSNWCPGASTRKRLPPEPRGSPSRNHRTACGSKTECGWRKKKRSRCRLMRIGRWPSRRNAAAACVGPSGQAHGPLPPLVGRHPLLLRHGCVSQDRHLQFKIQPSKFKILPGFGRRS